MDWALQSGLAAKEALEEGGEDCIDPVGTGAGREGLQAAGTVTKAQCSTGHWVHPGQSG